MTASEVLVRVLYRLLAVTLLLVLIASVACGGDDGNGESIVAEVGVVISETGAAGSPVGPGSRRGIEMALDEINNQEAVPGVHLEASFSDDESDPQLGAQLVRELADDGVAAILGPSLSNTAFRTNPVAQELGVPIVGISATAPGLTAAGDYVFLISLPDSRAVPAALERYLLDGEAGTAAIIHGSDEYSHAVAAVARRAAGEAGLDVVTEEEFPLGADETDMDGQAEAVAAAEPDVVFVIGVVPDAASAVLALRSAGLEAQLIGANGFNATEFLAATGVASGGALVAAAWDVRVDTPENQEFVREFRERYGEEPDIFAAEGYAATYVLAYAVRDAGSASREDIRDALAAVQDVPTPLGPVRFDEDRVAQYPPVVRMILDGAFSLLD